MQTRIDKYLAKRADLERWPLVAGDTSSLRRVVVIPALAEHDYLDETLASLAANPEEELRETLVICVVNNRGPAHTTTDVLENNQRTLADLERRVQQPEDGVRAAYVDAASPGCELPPKDGVGLARKIGLDWGLAVLRDNGAPRGLLLSLDADAAVCPEYLSGVRRHFEEHDAWAGVVAYAHRFDGPPGQVAAIVCYEIFLRYHVLGLRHAGSPYAYSSIGSTVVCRADAYAAVAGMNRRQGGEDFYFLQQLAKTGGVDEIPGATVYPSSRASIRAPFGTGPRVARFLRHERDEYVLYHPEGYGVLKEWLEAVTAHAADGAECLLEKADGICPQLCAFLAQNGFAKVWGRLAANARDESALLVQFHRWFDGFRTLKLIHHLRDNGFPEQDMLASVRQALRWFDAEPGDVAWERLRDDIAEQQRLLEHLRDLARRMSGRRHGPGGE